MINNKTQEPLTELKQAEYDLQVMKNRQTRLRNRQKYRRNLKDRKRTHRLILYGAALEAQYRDLEVLADYEVFSLIEKLLDIPEVVSTIHTALQQHYLACTGGID